MATKNSKKKAFKHNPKATKADIARAAKTPLWPDAGRITTKSSKRTAVAPPATMQLDFAMVTQTGWGAIDRLLDEVKSLAAARIEAETAIRDATSKQKAITDRADRLVAALGAEEQKAIAKTMPESEKSTAAQGKPAKGQSHGALYSAWRRLIASGAHAAAIERAHKKATAARHAYQVRRKAAKA